MNIKKIINFNGESHIGIGHTRWATHGKPNKVNSHPHQSQSIRFTIVHNGVIDNYRIIKVSKLKDYTFKSETDTEVIANLIEYYSNKMPVAEAIRKTIVNIEGSYALLILDKENPNKMFVAKNKTPMMIGISDEGFVLGSDVIPLAGICKSYIALEDLTYAEIINQEYKIYDIVGLPVDVKIRKLDIDLSDITKGDYERDMLKP